MLEQSEDGKVTYKGGSRKCMVAKKGIGVKEVIKMVNEITQRRVDTSDDEMVCGTSGRNGHDAMQLGQKGDGKQVGGKRLFGGEGGKCGVEKLQTILQLEGEIIDMSDDDENSVMSDDAGEEDTTDKGDDEGSTAKGSTEGNEGNDNVWPRSSLQA
ncbi:hypothetical protein Cgig2_030048 [Carnegiea gigantea]|uniref:Uncharacterized protein n=1 Tax=Carnegiea gigantea TaxID=171969 RepID=A0A9Q1K105_9CARY|nr:hypothetical protein Cgig2_030048 [Carnegiea gigantea]